MTQPDNNEPFTTESAAFFDAFQSDVLAGRDPAFAYNVYNAEMDLLEEGTLEAADLAWQIHINDSDSPSARAAARGMRDPEMPKLTSMDQLSRYWQE